MISEKLSDAFEGTELMYRNAEQKLVKRVYLDSAASALPLKACQEVIQQFLKYYSNPHSTVHVSARISTEVLHRGEAVVREFVGVDDSYVAAFLGSGCTLALNRLAFGLHQLRPSKDVVIATGMEHHSNDLPHRMSGFKMEYVPVLDEAGQYQGLSLHTIRDLLEKYKGRVNYIAITGASNVSGHLTPIHDVARLAHQYDVMVVVDGAQLVAHAPVKMMQDDPAASIDFFVFSGHKIYAPGAPGVLVGKRNILEQMKPYLYGGGMVQSVTKNDFSLTDNLFDREHAGTVNVTGILSLTVALTFLQQIGMDRIHANEKKLGNYLWKKLNTVPGIRVYPEGDPGERLGVVSFNIQGVPHELLARILNDYFGIAVRNQCFCAHPFVKECLLNTFWDMEEDENSIGHFRGMVRASLGLYSTEDDVNRLVDALLKITDAYPRYESAYDVDLQGRFTNRYFKQDCRDLFNLNDIIDTSFKNYFLSTTPAEA